MSEALKNGALDELSADMFDRDATEADFNRLTFGEQHDYEVRACRTAGAVYCSRVSADRISIDVQLPASLAFNGLTQEQAERYELYLHRQIESAIVWIIKERTLTS